MQRIAILAFSAFAYVVFLATFVYLIAFLSGLAVLSHGVDYGAYPAHYGEDAKTVFAAVGIDLVLILVFAVQHSTMARSWFKRWWTQFVPSPVERSVYVLTASLALILLFAGWRPIPAIVWQTHGLLAAMLWALFASGWVLVLISTFLISHFELFGLKQTWNHWCNRLGDSPAFYTPWLYRLVRHPLYLGFFLAFWAIPTMTLGHLLLASGMSVFMLVAIRFEERDLVDTFGDAYVRYRKRTGMLLPKVFNRQA